MLRAFLLCCFLAAAFSASPISIQVVEPNGHTTFYGHYALTPEAIVTSEFELKSVTAELGGKVIPLVFDVRTGRWRAVGPVDLTAVPSGTNLIRFDATDAFGQTTTTNATVVIDRPPVLHVSFPDGALARPVIRIEASCEDDLGDCTVQVMNDQNEVLLIASNRIDAVVDLSTYEGSIQRLRFYALDSRRSYAYDVRFVTALSNPRFQPIDSVPGALLQFNEDAFLFSEGAGAGRLLKLKTRDSGATQVIATNFADYPKPALTTVGVLFGQQMPAGGTRMIDLNRGSYIDLSEFFPTTYAPATVVSGQFGLVSRATYDVNGAAIMIRDFVARTNLIVPAGGSYADIGTNGTAVLVGDQVYQIRSGELRTITARTNAFFHMLRTDGTNTVWFEFNNASPYDMLGTLWAETREGIILLGEGYRYYDAINGLLPVAFNGGWLAFPRLGAQGQPQVWLRSPEGVLSQATFFAQGATLRALRHDGAVLVSYGTPKKLGFIAPGHPPVTLEPDLASDYFFEDEKIRAVIGNTLFDVRLAEARAGLSSPGIDWSKGLLSVYVTAAAPPLTFALERSTNFTDWISVSTHTVTNSLPSRLQLPVPPRRLTTGTANVYRLRVQ